MCVCFLCYELASFKIILLVIGANPHEHESSCKHVQSPLRYTEPVLKAAAVIALIQVKHSLHLRLSLVDLVG